MKALVPLLLAAGVLSAVARVGENVDSLESRYGDRYVVGTDEFDAASVVYGFDKEGKSRLRARGFQLFAVVDKDQRCQEIVYEKESGLPLAPNEIQGILISNAMGMGWTPVKGNVSGGLFRRSDGAIAWIAGPNRLELMTVERARLRKIEVYG